MIFELRKVYVLFDSGQNLSEYEACKSKLV